MAKDVWRVRLYFFVLWGALGTLVPFLNLFYSRQGIAGKEIGFFTMVNALVSVVFSPMVGIVSGRAKRPARIVQFGLLASGGLMMIVGGLDSVPVMLMLIGMNALVFAGVLPISISMAQAIVSRGKLRAGFGSVRLFGALGWALITYLGGVSVERYGIEVIFFAYLFLTFLGALVLFVIPCENEGEPSSFKLLESFGVIKIIFKDRSLLGLGMMIVLLFGALLGVRQFEVLYMDGLGASESLIGVSYTITALVEMPFMLLADRLIPKIKSRNVLLVGVLIDLMRLVLVIIVPTIPVIIVGRVIGGIAYALNIVALVQFVVERAPKGQNVAFQAVYNITLPYLVSVVVSPIVGRIFDVHGGYMMYVYGSAGVLVAGAVFLWMVRRRGGQVEGGVVIV